MLLEICANSYQSAINAEKGGANRIELCENLSIGGITPNRDLIKHVIEELSIPVNVLIRPRGADFVYNDEEFEQMLNNIEFCKSIDCNGIVSGVLNSNNTIDIERTKQLIETSKPLSFTFHRAFDNVINPIIAINQLINLKTDYILTSGQAETALEGLETLKRLKKEAKGKIEILVGGSVRSSNILKFKKAGFNEVHSSAITDSEHSDLEHSDLEEIKKLSSLCL